MKYVDLFCGIGSFHYSFKKLGFQCVMACDIYKPARDNYKLNYGMDVLGDICQINPENLEDYDILCAGFPCQPFSQAGKHNGFNDERGNMFKQIMKFVNINKPNFIILENVQGLLNHDKGRTFNSIKNDLETKYTVIHKVLKCNDYGIPQMRKRLFILGLKKSWLEIQNVSQEQINEIFNLKKYEKTTTLSSFLGKNFEKPLAYTIRCGGKKSPINDKHNWDGYMVDGKEYRLTVNDALKLQGFLNYNLIGKENEKWKLLGNTIPTIFTFIIGNQLRNSMFNPNMK